MKRIPRTAHRWILLAAILVMALRIGTTWRAFNDVIDEPYHIGAGIAMFDARRHVLGVQHPPLPRLVGAMPLVLSGIGGGDAQIGRTVDDLPAFTVGHRALLEVIPYWSALVRARAAMLVFPMVVVLYVYLIGRYLAGRFAGCAGAVLASTDPTLLAHGGLVTTDAAACAGFLAATYHGLRWVARSNLRRMLGAGLATGFALACKFSCGLVVPAIALVWLLRGRRAAATARRVIPSGAAALGIAVIVLWSTYGFEFNRIDRLNVADARALASLPGWLTRTPLPMPSAFVGYAVLAQHNAQGHFAYLNGDVSRAGWWYYFPEAILIKSPAALVVGLVLAALAMALAKRRRALRSAAVLVPAFLFLLFSMSAQINIGVRHVLPVIPLLYVFIVLWLTRRRWMRGISVLLILAAFVETAGVHPDYLAFFNVLVGGPSRGERHLLDSNLDWGQDQARLHAWLEANARGRTVTLRLFGNPRLYQWPRERFKLLPPDAPPQGLFAISKNYLYDVYPNPGSAWLRKLEPVARIGYSINVYDLDERGDRR